MPTGLGLHLPVVSYSEEGNILFGEDCIPVQSGQGVVVGREGSGAGKAGSISLGTMLKTRAPRVRAHPSQGIVVLLGVGARAVCCVVLETSRDGAFASQGSR